MKISALLPVYNAMPYLPESIAALLQARIPEGVAFEIVCIDDGSTDDSLAYLQSVQSDKIVLLRNENNKGLIATLNRGLDNVKTDYIVRVDADDIITNTRIEKQLEFMERNPTVVLVGSEAINFGENEEKISYPSDEFDLQARLLFHCPFVHSSIMLRGDIMQKNNLRYDDDFPHAEDYELWTRMLHFGTIANLPEVLVKRRVHAAQITQKNADDMRASTLKIYKNLLEQIEILPTEEELTIHYNSTREMGEINLASLQKIDAWFTKIALANSAMPIFPKEALHNFMGTIWLRHMAGKFYLGKEFYHLFQQSIFSPYRSYNFWQKIKFQTRHFLNIP